MKPLKWPSTDPSDKAGESVSPPGNLITIYSVLVEGTVYESLAYFPEKKNQVVLICVEYYSFDHVSSISMDPQPDISIWAPEIISVGYRSPGIGLNERVSLLYGMYCFCSVCHAFCATKCIPAFLPSLLATPPI